MSTQFKLFDKAGNVVKIGDKLTTFRGEVHTVESFQPPHKPSSTGHVSTDGGYYFPSVYGCHYVEQNTLAEELAKPISNVKFKFKQPVACGGVIEPQKNRGTVKTKHGRKFNTLTATPAETLAAALKALVVRCDGAEGVREDGSNIDTSAAHAALKKAGFEL